MAKTSVKKSRTTKKPAKAHKYVYSWGAPAKPTATAR